MVVCAACVRAPIRPSEWPSNLPPLQYYESVYDQDEKNQAVQTRGKYLNWVLRFYKGWELWQDGWQSTVRDILLGIGDASKKKRLRPMLRQLGRLISGEWAKHSSDRAIHTRELSIWGQALLDAMERRTEAQFIQQVTDDVHALLARTLHRSDISLERYIEGESELFDNQLY